MPEHYTKNTVRAEIFCMKCRKLTPWRIADGRRQYCLLCYEVRSAPHNKADEPHGSNTTLSLFEERGKP
jgi:hypothetical protein